MSPAQLVQPLANRALVLSLDTDFDSCMALVGDHGRTVYLANSMNSCASRDGTVAIELVQQFNWEVPDWVVIQTAIRNVSALGKGFLMIRLPA